MKKQTFVLTQAGLMLMSDSERKPMTAPDPQIAKARECAERLERYAVEADLDGCEPEVAGAATLLRQLAERVETLTKRLEIPEPPFEAYDGIVCRDETIRGAR